VVNPNALLAFSDEEAKRAKLLLATQVATMMGRKMEEGDWSAVYCRAKGIPDSGWSNLHIDVNFEGLGVEHKMVRCSGLNGRPLKSVCGTTLMHPSATRSIRIDDTSLPAQDVMVDVLTQYAALIDSRTASVLAKAAGKKADMRTGWLIWEDELAEFLYFEEVMTKPDPTQFRAEWNVTAARGVRKASKSLWVYEKKTGKKRYSVTTSAGIKIQPYFDVPVPSDPSLFYFRVQSEQVDRDTIILWIAHSTANALQAKIGALTKENVSKTVVGLAAVLKDKPAVATVDADMAVPVPISPEAHAVLLATFEGVSDEHRAQLMLKALAD